MYRLLRECQSGLAVCDRYHEKYGATLHLVHVYQEPGHLTEVEISSNIKMDWTRVAQSVEIETEKKLKEFCAEISLEVKSCHTEDASWETLC